MVDYRWSALRFGTRFFLHIHRENHCDSFFKKKKNNIHQLMDFFGTQLKKKVQVVSLFLSHLPIFTLRVLPGLCWTRAWCSTPGSTGFRFISTFNQVLDIKFVLNSKTVCLPPIQIKHSLRLIFPYKNFLEATSSSKRNPVITGRRPKYDQVYELYIGH